MKDWVKWFRHVSPYVHGNRGKQIVIALSGDALASANMTNIVHDVSLLNSLGMNIVLVFGARPQIDSALSDSGLSTRFHHGLRVTNDEALPLVLEAYGRLRAELEAKLSMGIADSPMHGAHIQVLSGNYVKAKPVGVLDGMDMGYTGQVRSIDSEAIQTALAQGAIVLVPSLGYSMTGDIFSLGYEDLAAELASVIEADKLVFLGETNGITDAQGQLVHELSVAQATEFLRHEARALTEQHRQQLAAAVKACTLGIKRAYLLGYHLDGAMLEEFFTRDGSGTMINADAYEQIRPARIRDISGIMSLIRPLEEQGYLVKRSQERLETELEQFYVDERDGAVVACAALHPFPSEQAGELSCLAVSDGYRQKGRGDRLLEIIEQQAIAKNLKKLFVLTTKTEQWFQERGFVAVGPETLPPEKKQSFNQNRNSKVLVKALDRATQ